MASDYQLSILKKNEAVGLCTDTLEDGTFIGWAIDAEGVTLFEPPSSYDTEAECIDAMRKEADNRALRSIVLE